MAEERLLMSRDKERAGEVMFETNKPRYITKGIESELSQIAVIIIWCLIDEMETAEKDYLQVFDINVSKDNDRKICIKHSQEQPEYENVHECDRNIFGCMFRGKIFVIDDETHQTMLLASEY